MDYVRKIANSDIFDNIIDLPENLRHKRVEIIILPYPDAGDGAEIYGGPGLKSRLGKNNSPRATCQEGPAWVETAREYYENRG